MRRGRWFSHVLGAWLPTTGALFQKLRQMCGTSWMSSALVFTSACQGPECDYCGKSLSAPEDVKRRGYHLLTFDANPESGVQAIVDDPLQHKPQCFLFIELPRISSADALAFFRNTSELKYNERGFLYNFLPWPWARSYGVQADNEMGQSTHVFCSEAICAFVQANGYPLGLVPCDTTPQLLAQKLVDTYAQELALKQFQLDPKSSVHADLKDRLVPVR